MCINILTFLKDPLYEFTTNLSCLERGFLMLAGLDTHIGT